MIDLIGPARQASSDLDLPDEGHRWWDFGPFQDQRGRAHGCPGSRSSWCEARVAQYIGVAAVITFVDITSATVV